jgi:hypothetical protein
MLAGKGKNLWWWAGTGSAHDVLSGTASGDGTPRAEHNRACQGFARCQHERRIAVLGAEHRFGGWAGGFGAERCARNCSSVMFFAGEVGHLEPPRQRCVHGGGADRIDARAGQPRGWQRHERGDWHRKAMR